MLGAIAPRVPARAGYALASWLADLNYQRNVQAVRGLRDNIRHAMGPSAAPAQVASAARRAYRILLQNYFDLFRLPELSAEQLRALIQITGWETLQSAHALGRGIILCSAHLGHVEGGLQIAALSGLPVLTPAEHIQPERLYRYFTSLRSRHGLRLIPSDGPLLEIFRALRRGEVVGLALDRDTTASGVEVTLCGAKARMPDGFAHLSAKMRAPLLTAFCYRLPDGHAHAHIGSSFIPDMTDDEDKTYHAALDFGVQALEQAITTHPDQWVLTTPLWI